MKQISLINTFFYDWQLSNQNLINSPLSYFFFSKNSIILPIYRVVTKGQKDQTHNIKHMKLSLTPPISESNAYIESIDIRMSVATPLFFV